MAESRSKPGTNPRRRGEVFASSGMSRVADSAQPRAARIAVRKTYKLYVGGQFPRSESGRSYIVRGADGAPLANAVRSSKKDLRDAIRAARAAAPGWAGEDGGDPGPGAVRRGGL